MKTRLSIDRFEGERKQTAVLLSDDGDQINVPRKLLPRGSRAGDVVALTVEKDENATRALASETRSLVDDLKRRDPGGDITL